MGNNAPIIRNLHELTQNSEIQRYDATSVIKDDVLYVLGGNHNGKSIPEILSIDLTTSFTIDSPPWSQSLKAPPLAFASSGVVFGEHDIQHNDWRRIAMASAPELNQRGHFKILSYNNGKTYLHGGFFNNTFLGDTYLFDTFLFNWTKLPAPQTPIIADDYSSVLLKDGRMIIIGGFEAPVDKVFVHRPISQIEIFDTIDNIWDKKIVPQQNEMTDHRRYHTSTLNPSVVILETSTRPFQWKIPVISGLKTPLLYLHCAELVENRYIFIMF
ncbi:20293_t:CDS:2, partial [Funneliformis geosporum]